MRPALLRALVGLLLWLLLWPGTARAFEVHTGAGGEPLRWASFPVDFWVGPSEVQKEARLRLVRRGFEAWGLPARSPVAFSYQGTVAEAFDSGDGVSSADPSSTASSLRIFIQISL